jgi:hypothetical protein
MQASESEHEDGRLIEPAEPLPKAKGTAKLSDGGPPADPHAAAASAEEDLERAKQDRYQSEHETVRTH